MDILGIVTLMMTLITTTKTLHLRKVFFLCLIASIFTSAAVVSSTAGAILMARIWLVATLFVFLRDRIRNLRVIIISSLISGIVVQIVIAGYQFFTQQSLMGYFPLGEPNFAYTIYIAKGVFNGVERLLPYGSTAHPNILAFYITTASLLLVKIINKRSLFALKGLLLLPAIGIVLATQSLTAALTLLIGALVLLYESQLKLTNRNTLFVLSITFTLLLAISSLFFLDHSQPSLYRRATLNQFALSNLNQQPFFGTGLYNSVIEIDRSAQIKQLGNFVQPIHHTPLLLAFETGIVGFMVLAYWLHSLKASTIWLVLIPALSFDHFLLTSPTGLYLLVLILLVWQEYQPKLQEKLQETEKPEGKQTD